MRKCVFLPALVLLLTGGCAGSGKPAFTKAELEHIPFAQKAGLPEPSGGFVLAVGGETLTSDETIAPLIEYFRPTAQRSNLEQFKEQARHRLQQILTTRVSNILLFQQAKRDAGADIDQALEKAADAEIRKFIAGFEGDYARAQQELKKMGHDWASFKLYQKKMILSQSYIASKLPEEGPVAYSELIDCYNKMKDEFFVVPARIKFRLIDIQPARLEVTDPNQTQQQPAEDLANELIRRIQTGEDFGELALKYSHGHRREFGGLWKPVQPDSLAKPYDILVSEADRIEPGQVAGPIEAGGHIFIMKLKEKRQKSFQPFEKVQSRLRAKIIFDHHRQAIDQLNVSFARQSALQQNSQFVDFCLEEIYRVSNQ